MSGTGAGDQQVMPRRHAPRALLAVLALVAALAGVIGLGSTATVTRGSSPTAAGTLTRSTTGAAGVTGAAQAAPTRANSRTTTSRTAASARTDAGTNEAHPWLPLATPSSSARLHLRTYVVLLLLAAPLFPRGRRPLAGLGRAPPLPVGS